jgi:hypothetical protein
LYLDKKRDPKVSVYQRRNPPLGIGLPKSKSLSSGIREHGRLNVQRFFGRLINPGLPPGPLDLQPFASATVPPVMDARVATIRGRTNSLVISFNVEDIVTHP